jgi:transcription elongation factor GreB
MIRYRPPSPKSSPYITVEGYARLREELDDLWARRREVVVHVTAAAAEGDRSENAEYIYRKKQLRELDRRIRYLQKRLPDLQVIDSVPADGDRVFFGAQVTLCDAADDEVRHRLVGADEIDPEKSWISIDSPMAKALLGHTLDDEIVVKTPTGPMSYWVVSVRYQ